jgi:hypothetical protein
LNRHHSLLTLDRLLDLPHWEVVVAGLRNSRRVLETLTQSLPDRTLFEDSLACAEEVVRGRSDTATLEPFCHRIYQIAARLAARNRSDPGSLAELATAGQAMHMTIDSVADFDLDSYESVCATYLSLKAASRLPPRGLIQQVGLDLDQVIALSEQHLPGEILDAFGPLWKPVTGSDELKR